jgi:putative membrane protein
MKQAIFRWFVLTVAVWIATNVPGITCNDWKSLLIAALILGILNSSVKPILRLLSLPFIIVTFGFFLLVINALLLRLTAWLTPGGGFQVSGFWPAVGGSLVISIVSMSLGYSRPHRQIIVDRTETTDTYDPTRRGPPPGTGRIIDVE